MGVWFGVLMAVLCAVGTNIAFLCRHRGACAAPEVRWKQPIRSGLDLWRSGWFAVGMGVAFVAWALHVGALAVAPISIVQAVIAGGLVLVAVFAERLFGLKLERRQWIAVGVMAVGLALLTAVNPTPKHAQSNYSLPAMIAFEAGFLAFGAFLLGSHRMVARRHYALLLGVSAGTLFGVSDVAIKGISAQLSHSGPIGILSPWLVSCIAASVLAFYASALSLQKGEAVSVISVTTAAATVAGIAGGVIVFRDPLSDHPALLVLQAVAFILVAGASALAPAPLRAARPDNEEEAAEAGEKEQ